MTGHVGDQITIESFRVGEPPRKGEVLEVIESPYGTRYQVRWDDGHESTIRPFAGAVRFQVPLPGGPGPRRCQGPRRRRPKTRRLARAERGSA